MAYTITITQSESYTTTERIMEKTDKGDWEYVEGKAKEVTKDRDVKVLEQRVDSLDLNAVVKAINRL